MPSATLATYMEAALTFPEHPSLLPILYSFRRCPYAIRARMMLAACGVSYELREVQLKTKPASMLEVSPKGTVPVLFLPQSKQVIDESLDIMRWAMQQADPHHWLALDAANAANVSEASAGLKSDLIGENDGPFKLALDRYKYPHKHESSPDVADESDGRAPTQSLVECLSFLTKLEVLLTKQRWLGAERLCPVDIAIFPFVRQFHMVDEQVLSEASFPRLKRWLERLSDSELFAAVMAKHEPWAPGDMPIIYERGILKRDTNAFRTGQNTESASPDQSPGVQVAAFYRFVHVDDCEALRATLKAGVQRLGLRGSVLIAAEGINGMLAGLPQHIDEFFTTLRKDSRFDQLSLKFQQCKEMPFYHTKVRVKKEIVACKDTSIDALSSRGHLDAEAWDALLCDSDVTVIDVRNDYEYQLGHFHGALNPHTESFGEFAQFVRQELNPETNRKIAMYCTGGIRCEKASVIMRELGFPEVYQLDGGILNYLEHHKNRGAASPQWQGECFVFDERIAVDANLQPTRVEHRCTRCGQPCHPADGCMVCSLDP